MSLRVIAAAPLAGVAWSAPAADDEPGRGRLVVVAKLVWQLASEGTVTASAAETPGLHRARHAPEELEATSQPRLVVRGWRACEGRVLVRRDDTTAADLACPAGREPAQLPMSAQDAKGTDWLVAMGLEAPHARRWCKVPEARVTASIGGAERWTLAHAAHILCVETWTLAVMYRLSMPWPTTGAPSHVALALEPAREPSAAASARRDEASATGIDLERTLEADANPRRSPLFGLPFVPPDPTAVSQVPPRPAPTSTRGPRAEAWGDHERAAFDDEGTVALGDVGPSAALPFAASAPGRPAGPPRAAHGTIEQAAEDHPTGAPSVGLGRDPSNVEVTALVEEPTERPDSPTVALAHAPPGPASATSLAEETGTRKLVLDHARAGRAMYGMDLTGADLRNLDLEGAILSDARLVGARLGGAILRKARLSGARLAGADLTGADLAGADLTRTDLARARLDDATLDGASLSDANLAMARCERASFEGANADRAKLMEARLDDATLAGASLREADLSGASFARASFADASLAGARLADSTGEGAVFTGARLDGASCLAAKLVGARLERVHAARTRWEHADLTGARFDEGRLRDAAFTKAKVDQASFLRADLAKADLSTVSGEQTNFREANLDGAELRMGQLPGACFDDARLVDANAQKLVAPGASLVRAALDGTNLRGAKLKGCDLSSAQLGGCDLRDADLENATLVGTDLTRAKCGGAVLKGVRG
jgi:uncharacterized protein YjbI with pentapeptide repeats